MKETFILQKHLIVLLWILLAQPIGAQDPDGKVSFGDPTDLRGLETIHITILDTSTGKPTTSIFGGRVLYNNIRNPIQRELPNLTFVPSAKASIRIFYSQSAKTTGRNIAIGFVLRSETAGAALLMDFTSSTDNKWRESPAETFAAKFIKAYRDANPNAGSGTTCAELQKRFDTVFRGTTWAELQMLMGAPTHVFEQQRFLYARPGCTAVFIIDNQGKVDTKIFELNRSGLTNSSGLAAPVAHPGQHESLSEKQSPVLPPTPPGTEIYLTVEVVPISNIFEVIGRTEPGASVVINEEPVVLISADGSFKHFTSPLPHKGKNVITVTAQDRRGNSKTLTRDVQID